MTKKKKKKDKTKRRKKNNIEIEIEKRIAKYTGNMLRWCGAATADASP